MGDFFQPGVITTLHRLKKVNLDRMEMELELYSRYNPIGLVLPSLYSELKEKALKTIVSEIKRVKYINQVIITLGKTGQAEKVIVAAFSITFGGIVLALAISFGWGGKELAKDFLERIYRKKEKGGEGSDQISHI